MPTLGNTLAWLTILVLWAGLLVQQIGLQTVIGFLGEFDLLHDYFATTHCYASIKTLSDDTPRAQCFSIVNGKFSKIITGPTSESAGPSGHVIPGLWDGHGHLVQYGESLSSVDLFGTKSMDDVQKRLVEYKSRNPDSGDSQHWLRGVGWDQANFEGKWPTADDLEINDSFKDLFVMLDRVDVHCIWVSDKVLQLLPSELPDIPGGEIPAKGVFCDNAMDIVLNVYPKPSIERKTKFIKDAMTELNKLGIVGMHDAGVVPSELQLYGELALTEDWNVRVYAMIECDIRNTFCPDTVDKMSTDNAKLFVQSVKLFGDGALGSWGSAMLSPYTDKPSSVGSLLVNTSTLTSLTHSWAAAGYQVNIHAIGDLANRNAIDAFESALKNLCTDTSDLKACQQIYRFRIEHAQIIHPDDQKRMLELGIIPSIQPTHATSDMGYAEARLGPQRTKDEAYRMRSLLPLSPVLGSDFPVEPASIFSGMYAAITRRSPHTGLDPSGGKDGWYPEETLTLEQALRGFTVSPAYGAFLEGKAGVIQKGAFADWVVLDEPLEKVGVEGLRTLKVRETWVGGKRLYSRSEAEVEKEGSHDEL